MPNNILSNPARFLSTPITSLLLAAALAGCGGGGGGTSTNTSTFVDAASPAVAQAPDRPSLSSSVQTTNQDMVTSVTPPTYSAGSVQKGAWDVLMTERQNCGFGLLQQDARLDAASSAHSYYLAQNSIDTKGFVGGHNENPADSYFTGTNGLERAVAKGVARVGGMSINEILDEQNVVHSRDRSDFFPTSEARGAASMRRLIGTVYHLSGAMYAGRAGGVGTSHLSGPFDVYTMEVYRFGTLIADLAGDNKQRIGSGNVVSYPCASARPNASFAPATEGPNPFPEITDQTVLVGTPIYFKADAGSALAVSAATVTKVSDGALQTLRQLNKANDPAAKIGSNEVFLVPTSALVPASSYTVNAIGTIDGVAFTRTFTFTTAP